MDCKLVQDILQTSFLADFPHCTQGHNDGINAAAWLIPASPYVTAFVEAPHELQGLATYVTLDMITFMRFTEWCPRALTTRATLEPHTHASFEHFHVDEKLREFIGAGSFRSVRSKRFTAHTSTSLPELGYPGFLTPKASS